MALTTPVRRTRPGAQGRAGFWIGCGMGSCAATWGPPSGLFVTHATANRSGALDSRRVRPFATGSPGPAGPRWRKSGGRSPGSRIDARGPAFPVSQWLAWARVLSACGKAAAGLLARGSMRGGPPSRFPSSCGTAGALAARKARAAAPRSLLIPNLGAVAGAHTKPGARQRASAQAAPPPDIFAWGVCGLHQSRWQPRDSPLVPSSGPPAGKRASPRRF